MLFATTDDMAVRVPGGIPDADLPRAEAYLEDASALIVEVVGEVTGEVPATIKRVCLAAALRAWSNPSYLSSEQLGDYQTSRSALGGVYLTDEERNQLRRLRAQSGLWVQPVARRDSLVHSADGWLYVSDGGASFPWVPVADE